MTVQWIALVLTLAAAGDGASGAPVPKGFRSLFNGKDLSGWKIPDGDNGHWKVVDGVIDYDAGSEAKTERSLFSEESFGNFVLRVDWRIKDTPFINPQVPIILPDGSHKKGADGKTIRISVPDSDSGIYLRGQAKAQVNIWGWPIGSGEIYGYRTDEKMPPEVRAGVTPKTHADHNIGEWNTFEITMRGDRVTVDLNGKRILDKAQLPGIPEQGPLALQHHGDRKDHKQDGPWVSPPALVQFRNIYVKALK